MNVHPYPSEQGASSIEFAASIIVLCILIFGTVGVAMSYYTYEVMNEYARDASRYAIVHGNNCSYQVKGVATSCSIGVGDNFALNGVTSGNSPADIALKSYLNHQIFPGINGNNLIVSTNYAHAPGLVSCFATDCNGPGDQVTVEVSYPYLYSIPFVPQQAFTMHARSTMVISQ